MKCASARLPCSGSPRIRVPLTNRLTRPAVLPRLPTAVACHAAPLGPEREDTESPSGGTRPRHQYWIQRLGYRRVVLIDAHQHLGDCRVFDLDVPEEMVLAAAEEHGLDHVLVMPFPGAGNAAAVHDRIAALTESTAGRVRGIVCLNPHQDRAAYAAEAERCVKNLGFVALKLHTLGHAVEPASADGMAVFAEAARLGVPVIVHTGGAGEPFASPSHVLPAAR